MNINEALREYRFIRLPYWQSHEHIEFSGGDYIDWRGKRIDLTDDELLSDEWECA